MLSRTSTARKLFSNWQHSRVGNQPSKHKVALHTAPRSSLLKQPLACQRRRAQRRRLYTRLRTSRQACCQVWRALPLGRRAAHWRRELELEPCAHGWGDRVLDLAYAKIRPFRFLPPVIDGSALRARVPSTARVEKWQPRASSLASSASSTRSCTPPTSLPVHPTSPSPSRARSLAMR